MKIVARVFLIMAAIAFVMSFLVTFGSLEYATAIDDAAFQSLVGVGVAWGTMISVCACLIYQGLYLVIILPITIVASAKGLWKNGKKTLKVETKAPEPIFKEPEVCYNKWDYIFKESKKGENLPWL